MLMEIGATGPGNALYTVYSPMCHQFAFRSMFFFGDQMFYPRKIAGTDLTPFETYAVRDPHFANVNLDEWSADLELSSRSFRGNKEFGYKAALCERDIAIYGTMVLAGLAYTRLRGRLRPASIWLYIFLGLGPIGLDGFSQLLSYPPFEYWPVRETLPGYRILTGAMFGMMNIWLAFPYLEASMKDSIASLQRRMVIIQEHLDGLEVRR